MSGWQYTRWGIAVCFALVASAGCGDGGSSPMDPNEEWAEPGLLLGSWVATRVEHRRQSDPATIAVVSDTFTLVVDSIGRYTARLTPSGAREDGWIRVQPPSVIFRPTSPAAQDSPGSLTVRADTVGIVGDSMFDFGTGTEEPSILEIDLIPS